MLKWFIKKWKQFWCAHTWEEHGTVGLDSDKFWEYMVKAYRNYGVVVYRCISCGKILITNGGVNVLH